MINGVLKVCHLRHKFTARPVQLTVWLFILICKYTVPIVGGELPSNPILRSSSHSLSEIWMIVMTWMQHVGLSSQYACLLFNQRLTQQICWSWKSSVAKTQVQKKSNLEQLWK
jgi:hypothetical protein